MESRVPVNVRWRMMYARPIKGLRRDNCQFYHSLSLGARGEITGDWDLRPTVDAYLGGADFAGKRVLDVGTAGGYLAFEAERRGATEVVALDMDSAERWERVPFPSETSVADERDALHDYWERMRNGFWYAHEALDSKVLRAECDLYNIPSDLGEFDLAVLGMILPHVSDPFRALDSVALTAKSLVITQWMPNLAGPVAYFLPRPDKGFPRDAWWAITRDCFADMLSILGFEIRNEITAKHRCNARDDLTCTALYAERVRPATARLTDRGAGLGQPLAV